MVASARRIPTAKQVGPGQASVKVPRPEWQADAWDYYDAVPEIKHSARFVGAAMAKLRLFPAVIDPNDPEKVVPVTAPESGVPAEVAAAATAELGRLRSTRGGQAEIKRALAVNLRAPIVLSRLLVEQMAARGSGHIVLISSLAGRTAQAGGSLYSATKFGLRGFGQALRADLRERGVGVSVVFPGFIRDAGMFHDSGARLPGFVGTNTPDEVAVAVLRAIEHNRGEVSVAPLAIRAGTKFAEIAPATAARAAQRLGGDQVAQQLRDGQAAKQA